MVWYLSSSPFFSFPLFYLCEIGFVFLSNMHEDEVHASVTIDGWNTFAEIYAFLNDRFWFHEPVVVLLVWVQYTHSMGGFGEWVERILFAVETAFSLSRSNMTVIKIETLAVPPRDRVLLTFILSLSLSLSLSLYLQRFFRRIWKRSLSTSTMLHDMFCFCFVFFHLGHCQGTTLWLEKFKCTHERIHTHTHVHTHTGINHMSAASAPVTPKSWLISANTHYRVSVSVSFLWWYQWLA